MNNIIAKILLGLSLIAWVCFWLFHINMGVPLIFNSLQLGHIAINKYCL